MPRNDMAQKDTGWHTGTGERMEGMMPAETKQGKQETVLLFSDLVACRRLPSASRIRARGAPSHGAAHPIATFGCCAQSS